MSNVGQRYLQGYMFLAGRESMLVIFCQRPIGERSGAHDRPVNIALSFKFFLTLMIQVGGFQYPSDHDTFPEDVQVVRSVSGAQRRLADQALHTCFLHRLNYLARSFRAHFTSASVSER